MGFLSEGRVPPPLPPKQPGVVRRPARSHMRPRWRPADKTVLALFKEIRRGGTGERRAWAKLVQHLGRSRADF